MPLAAASQGITDTVISGPFLFAAGLAIAAGVVSFASPCVVPLVPGYLAYLAGLVGADTRDAAREPPAAGPATAETGPEAGEPAALGVEPGSGAPPTAGSAPAGSAPVGSAPAGSAPAGSATATTRVAPASGTTTTGRGAGRTVRWRAVVATCLFVAGFSVVFLLETALVLGLAHTVMANQQTLTRIGGAITIVMGLALAGAIPFLQRDLRPRARPRGRIWGAPVLGAAFGTGWLACTSPTLAGVVALSVSTEWNGYAWRGLVLVLFYCAGLGIPFLLLSIGFGWATTVLGFLRRHAGMIQLIGAGALIVIGVLMVTGVWSSVIGRLQGAVVVL